MLIGAGKSTFINYLSGVELKRVLNAGLETFVVDKLGVAGIKNGAVSATLLPGVHATDNGVLTDCPGLFDTRAPAVNVANGINVAACAEAASAAKFVVLIEFSSVKAARGNALKEVFLALAESLGGVEGLKRHADSVLLLVSKAPLDYELANARELLNEAVVVLNEDERDVALELFGRAELYHPLDQGHESWTKLSALKSKLEALVPIPKPGQIYRSPLSFADEKLLRDITNELVAAVTRALNEQCFRACAESLAALERLNVVNLRIVHVLVADAMSQVNAQIERFFNEAQYCIFNERFDDASQLAQHIRSLEKALRKSAPTINSTLAVDLLRSLSLRVGDLEKLIEHRRLEEQRFAQAQLEQRAQSEETAWLRAKLAKLEMVNRGLTSELESVQNELVQAQETAKSKARYLEATFLGKIQALEERAARGEKKEESTAEAAALRLEMDGALKILHEESAAREAAIKRSIEEQKALAQRKAAEEAMLRRNLDNAEEKQRRQLLETRQAAEAAAAVEAAERRAAEAANQARAAAAMAQNEATEEPAATQHLAEGVESSESPYAIRVEGEALVRDLSIRHDANLEALKETAQAQATTREARLTQTLQALQVSMQKAKDDFDPEAAGNIQNQVKEAKAAATLAKITSDQELARAKETATITHINSVEMVKLIYATRSEKLEELLDVQAASTAANLELTDMTKAAKVRFEAATQARAAALEAIVEKKLAEGRQAMSVDDFAKAKVLKDEAGDFKVKANAAAAGVDDESSEVRVQMEAEEQALKSTVTYAMTETKRCEEELAVVPKTLDAMKEIQPLFEKRFGIRRQVLNHWVNGAFLDASKQAGELLMFPWSIHAINLARIAEKMASEEASAIEAAACFDPVFPPAAQLDSKADAHACQACGVKLSGFRVSMVAAVKYRCKTCGHVICKACSPTQADVAGHSTPQRICTPCVEAKATVEKELQAATSEAEKRCAAAHEAAHTAVIDDTAAIPELQDGSAASALMSAVKEATAAGKQKVAAAFQSKLDEVGEKSLVLAIALDAFPVNTIVRASIISEGVAAGTVGEVVGHTSNGTVEVRFRESEMPLNAATLRPAPLPNGWVVNQTCICIDELRDEIISTGQSGTVKGWSKPLDDTKIMADFSGVQVNVELRQIEPEEEQLEFMQQRASNNAALDTAQDAYVMEQEQLYTSARSYRSAQQPTPQQLLPPTTAGIAEVQDMVRIFAPPGCAAGAMLSINHNGTEYLITMPAGVSPGQQFLVNLSNCEQVMADSGGTQVNEVDLCQIEPEQVQLVSMPPGADIATIDTAREADAMEQERASTSTTNPSSNQQPAPQQQLPQTTAGIAEDQDMIKVLVPPGCAAGTILKISHNGPEFVVAVPAGVSPGQQFLVNVPRT